jgi:hypothetical protein
MDLINIDFLIYKLNVNKIKAKFDNGEVILDI